MWHWWKGIISGRILSHINPTESFLKKKLIFTHDKHPVQQPLRKPLLKINQQDQHFLEKFNHNFFNITFLKKKEFQVEKNNLLKKIHQFKREVFILSKSIGQFPASVTIGTISCSPYFSMIANLFLKEKKYEDQSVDYIIYHDISEDRSHCFSDPSENVLTVLLSREEKQIIIKGHASAKEIEEIFLLIFSLNSKSINHYYFHGMKLKSCLLIPTDEKWFFRHLLKSSTENVEWNTFFISKESSYSIFKNRVSNLDVKNNEKIKNVIFIHSDFRDTYPPFSFIPSDVVNEYLHFFSSLNRQPSSQKKNSVKEILEHHKTHSVLKFWIMNGEVKNVRTLFSIDLLYHFIELAEQLTPHTLRKEKYDPLLLIKIPHTKTLNNKHNTILKLNEDWLSEQRSDFQSIFKKPVHRRYDYAFYNKKSPRLL